MSYMLRIPTNSVKNWLILSNKHSSMLATVLSSSVFIGKLFYIESNSIFRLYWIISVHLDV